MKPPRFLCTVCGELRIKFRSRCPSCGNYSTLITIEQARARGLALPIGMGDGAGKRPHYMTTPIVGLNEVASSGPGIVRGICYLFTGDPGAGKSTLLIQTAVHLSRRRRVIYAFLEPGEDFIGALSMRLGLDMSHVRGVTAESVDELIERVAGAEIAILDSLQGLSQRSGEPIDEIAHKLAEHAHETGTTWLLIGHINKDGDVSGVMATEHWVDATLHLSREYGQGLRVLSSGKNRYGPERVRFLRMTEDQGLVDVPDASSHLLADRVAGEIGSCVGVVLVEGWKGTAAKAGTAPVLVEVQALTSIIETNEKTGKLAHPPRVVVSGIPADRVRLVLEVLAQRADVDTSDVDVTVNVCGDLDVSDRGLEAPVALAIVSAIKGVPLPADMCAWGEIDLTGRLRGVVDTKARAAEAKTAGFANVVSSGRLIDAISTLIDSQSSRRDNPKRRDRKPAADARKPDARRRRAVPVPADTGRVRKKGARGRVRLAKAS